MSDTTNYFNYICICYNTPSGAMARVYARRRTSGKAGHQRKRTRMRIRDNGSQHVFVLESDFKGWTNTNFSFDRFQKAQAATDMLLRVYRSTNASAETNQLAVARFMNINKQSFSLVAVL